VTFVTQADYADCEVHDGGLFAQDVNAWSSLAYVAVGAIITVNVVRRRIPVAFLALAAVITVEGIGSVLYHGDPSDTARLVHDAAAIAMLGFIAGWHAGRVVNGRSSVGAMIGLAAGLAAGIVGGSTSAAVTNASVVGGITIVALSEVVARRRRLVPILDVTTLALGALAGLAWVLGTSDSPLCAERSWAQPHGAWHILSALVMLVWVDRAAAR
jgi:hypothetical protein